MGVQIYLLDRRQVTLLIDGLPQRIGTLRSFWKATEIDKERAAEMEAVKKSLRDVAAPVAVMIAEVCDVPLATDPERSVSMHLVLGWDADRCSVTDFDWDYLPILGYAARTSSPNAYALHEERDGLLHPMSRARAIELSIVNHAGQLVRQGQPSIAECRSVKPYIRTYAEADCVLANGRAVEILTSIEPGNMPPAAWYKGKRPADVIAYPAEKAA